MSSYSVAPNLYVISDGNLNIYTVGQTFRNGEVPPVSNPLIPLENEEVTTWAAVSIETA